ncbi:MAG: hypothetical protein JNN07_02560 [Verrucomicrobiales bacterium]|nr:hypothetical protein [Verrucomicrobiales bacterium]
MRKTLARALSILGHPVLLVPASATSVAAQSGATATQLRTVVAILGGLVGTTLLFSALMVKSGRWTHVDAVRREDRKTMNLVLLTLLLLPGLILLQRDAYRPVGWALSLGGGIVLAALLLGNRLKSSLHLAFGTFSILLFWGQPAWLGLGALFLAGVAWSRLELGRHTPPELVCGSFLGLLAGAAFNLLNR